MKYISALMLSLLVFQADASRAENAFCKSVRSLSLNTPQDLGPLFHKTETTRTSENSSGDGRAVEDIERVVKPYSLSEELRQTFADGAEDPGSDYDVYRTRDGTLFDFKSVDGSDKCPSDIWATRTGDHLELLDDGPELGDACDVVRIFGICNNAPLMLQYAYGEPGFDGKAKVQEIRAIEMSARGLDNVCVIKPK
ncbi:hypothetical protein [Agrobacterium rubi]|uniref:hypothetical protein n=1 Tax=Agrobacterium rubi TaxID=28099 RepID=UPI0015736A22|nr:hypothetical protein [Agrobacterium rubi]NTE89619.1 hypothetical protein [Agrobacterium rubi]NTF05531.1 hypothetical protein [Agrobacterium rubi]